MPADVLILGDTMVVVNATIVDVLGNPRNLTGATVTFRWQIGLAGVVKTRGATVIDAAGGRVRTLLDQTGDVYALGTFKANHVVVDAAAKIGTQYPPFNIPVKAGV